MQKRSLHILAMSVAVCLVFMATASSFAQKTASIADKKLPKDFLKHTKPQNNSPAVKAMVMKKAGLIDPAATPAASSGVPGIDSLQNWTGQFTSPGFDSNSNPQSVWPYAMVGSAPESNRTSVIPNPIIPVTIKLLDASGHVATDPNTGALLVLKVTPAITDAVLHSPLLEPVQFTSGFGQFNDQMQRAEFWNRIQHEGPQDSHDDNNQGWHNVLNPSLKTTRSMSIPYGYGYYALNNDGTCCAYMLLDGNTFGNLLFPPTYPVDNSTVIGAAELAGDMTTHDLSTLLFNNIYLYSGTTANCCVLGYHTYDIEPGIPQNGNLPRLYVMNYSSWISPGLFDGPEDVAVLTHEMSETFNDPFINNQTPWWLSVDPFTGFGNCQDNLETGDVIEVLSDNPDYSIAHHNRTYHLQNEALFPWFAAKAPSPARLRAYSFPDESTLLYLSPGNLLPGCTPAP